MRIATGILSFFFMIFVFYQGNHPLPEFSRSENETMSLISNFMGIFLILGLAFVFNKPRVSKTWFIVAGSIGLLGAVSPTKEFASWGVICFIFAFMSHKAIKEISRKRNIEQDIDHLKSELDRLKQENDVLKKKID